jgi:hypothetical protein
MSGTVSHFAPRRPTASASRSTKFQAAAEHSPTACSELMLS